MKKIAIAIASLVVIQPAGLEAQCLMYPVDLAQRVQQSSLVIEGKVIDQTSFWNPEHTLILTSNLVEVYKSFKGATPAYVEIITEGGTVGEEMQTVEPSLLLQSQETGVFTLTADKLQGVFGEATYNVYAAEQGFIRYDLAANTAVEPFHTYADLNTGFYGQLTALTHANYQVVKPVDAFALIGTPSQNKVAGIAAITGISPTTITAGTFSVLTINGNSFGATRGTSYVEFKNANNGGSTFIQPDASEYVAWSATQIQVKVPSSGSSGPAGTGVVRVVVGGVAQTSAQTLTVSYGHMNVLYMGAVYNTKHIGQTTGGYTWTYNTAFNANASAKASFERSFKTWRCGTFINWRMAVTTSTIAAAASDGVNIVTFQAGLPAGVLGRCTSYWSGCAAGTGFNWYVNELDIAFTSTISGATWNYGPAAPTASQYDFESVSAHELGHGHQLTHVINSAELMHYSISNGQSKRTLSASSLNGGLAVMARNTAGAVCSKALMTALTATNCGTSVTAPFITGIAEQEDEAPAFAVYPNPGTGVFTLENTRDLKAELLVFNAVGQLLLTQHLDAEKTTLDLSAYGSGLYYVQLRNSDLQKTLKLMIQ